MMDDRIRAFEGVPQRYGSQLHDTVNGLAPYPLEDVTQVEQWRQEVGLPPLGELLSGIRETPPPTAEEIAAHEAEELEWRRKAGLDSLTRASPPLLVDVLRRRALRHHEHEHAVHGVHDLRLGWESPVSSSCLSSPRISLQPAATFSGDLCAVVQPECVIVTRHPPRSSVSSHVTSVNGDTLVVNM